MIYNIITAISIVAIFMVYTLAIALFYHAYKDYRNKKKQRKALIEKKQKEDLEREKILSDREKELSDKDKYVYKAIGYLAITYLIISIFKATQSITKSKTK